MTVVAVALHDVEPRTFGRVKGIRAWLLERDVTRVTLLVIPAADQPDDVGAAPFGEAGCRAGGEPTPIGTRAPALAAWLRCQVTRGDAVAQHGLAHKAAGVAPWPRSIVARWQGGAAAEFPGLGADDAARRVLTGRRLLGDIELDPRGFVAPGYAYTRALRGVLGESFEWFADARRIHARSRNIQSRALRLGSSTPLKRLFSPPLVRAAARTLGPVMRIDVHPADFDLPGHVATLESLLARAEGRDAVTYDELVA
jgi:predicted deacetylase